MSRTRAWVEASVGALRDVLHNRDLRRLELAWTLHVASDWIFFVTLLIVAYQLAGAVGVGVLGGIRFFSGTFGATLATMAIRHRGERILVYVHVARSASAVLTAIALSVDWPLHLVFGCAAVFAALSAAVRPTNSALLPALARSPSELVAANVASSAGMGIGSLVGPALGGISVAFVGPAWTSLGAALGLVVAALTVSTIRIPAMAATHEPHAARQPFARSVRTLLARHGTALIIGGFVAQVFVRGLLTTFIVVASIELLGLGEPGVGFLNASIGAGGLIGAIVAMSIAGRSRLARVFSLSLAFWGLPLALVAAWPVAAVAAAALFVVGASDSVLDVSGFTLMQRTVPNRERAGAFGLLEVLGGLSAAAGALVAPFLVGTLGIRGALAGSGLFLPLIAILSWARIARTDDEAIVPARELALLRNIPMFAPLPMTALERLAAGLTRVTYASGETVMAEGEPGDHYVLIAEGSVDVIQGGRWVSSCRAGEGVGEIALVRGVPRTATVIAREETSGYALSSADFIGALTGFAESAAAGEAMAGERLARSAAEEAAGAESRTS
jgi:MFS family permease